MEENSIINKFNNKNQIDSSHNLKSYNVVMYILKTKLYITGGILSENNLKLRDVTWTIETVAFGIAETINHIQILHYL